MTGLLDNEYRFLHARRAHRVGAGPGPLGRRRGRRGLLRGRLRRCHRAQAGRAGAHAHRAARSAHRPRQPRPVHARARAGAVAARLGVMRCAVRRHRPLQAHQRRPRARRGRFAAARGRPQAAGRAAGGRRPLALRRRRVHRLPAGLRRRLGRGGGTSRPGDARGAVPRRPRRGLRRRQRRHRAHGRRLEDGDRPDPRRGRRHVRGQAGRDGGASSCSTPACARPRRGASRSSARSTARSSSRRSSCSCSRSSTSRMVDWPASRPCCAGGAAAWSCLRWSSCHWPRRPG